MNIDISLVFKVKRLNEAFGLTIRRLLHVALLHAKENDIVLVYAFLIN